MTAGSGHKIDMTLSRRGFIASTAAAAGLQILRASDAGAQPAEGVRLGVISDTHATGPESVECLSEAFRFLRDRGVAGVLHCGDVTDMGTLDQLDAFSAAWHSVFDEKTKFAVALGNRDMMDSKKISDEVRLAAKGRAILDNPREAFRRAMGVDIGDGVYAGRIGGVWIVSAPWKKEGDLEAFFMAHPEIAASGAPVVVLQHKHHKGTVFGGKLGDWAVCDPRATCWMELFPDFISFSGHSHITHMRDGAVHDGAFHAIAAGSYCMEKSRTPGGRDVSIITFAGGAATLERFDMRTGRSVRSDLELRRPRASLGASGGFTFMQWNIGHFCFGRTTSTAIAAADADSRAAAFRAEIARHAPDVIGLCEHSAVFSKDGSAARDRILQGFASVDEGQQSGYQCNAVAARAAGMRRIAQVPYVTHSQPTYYLAEEVEISGRRVVFVQTHLDLGDAAVRRSQMDALLHDFAAHPAVVISGDFNVSDEAEYAPFAAAGYAAANCAAFGRFPTHRRRRLGITPAIDNVFAKGLRITDACLGDYAFSLSDHRPVVVRLEAT